MPRRHKISDEKRVAVIIAMLILNEDAAGAISVDRLNRGEVAVPEVDHAPQHMVGQSHKPVFRLSSVMSSRAAHTPADVHGTPPVHACAKEGPLEQETGSSGDFM
jgi:hypothetical protein